jgi:hypothetical protein
MTRQKLKISSGYRIWLLFHLMPMPFLLCRPLSVLIGDNSMKKFLFIFFLILLTQSCISTKAVHNTNSSSKNGYYITTYSAFGPPQIASKLLGRQVWQWDDVDNHKPIKFDIKVVIYRNIDLELIKTKFPVLPHKKQDYRYVEYEAAVSFLDYEISALNSELKTANDPSEIGILYIYPLQLQETVIAIERALRK